jgi:hypothetical protein
MMIDSQVSKYENHTIHSKCADSTRAVPSNLVILNHYGKENIYG